MINRITTGKQFTDYWDWAIRYWASGSAPIVEANQHCWFNLWYNYFTEWLMPEPYWGDPDNCSIVILNINPRGVMDPQAATDDMCHFDKRNDTDTVCGLMQGCYSKEAKGFPQLCPPPSSPFYNYDGKKWWRSRKNWLNRLLKSANIGSNKEEKRPFAIELCGWHSFVWGENWKTPEVKDYLEKMLIPVLEYSILKSDLKIGVCPWKGIANTLMEKFGYVNVSGKYSKKLSSYKYDQTGNYFQPLNEKKRSYIVLKKKDVVFINEEGTEEKKDIYIIATWGARGKVPSSDFNNFERDLINAIP